MMSDEVVRMERKHEANLSISGLKVLLLLVPSSFCQRSPQLYSVLHPWLRGHALVGLPATEMEANDLSCIRFSIIHSERIKPVNGSILQNQPAVEFRVWQE
jgi:hypothetical protein